MTAKTRHCETCWYFDGTKAVEDLPPCEKGHSPRFHRPKDGPYRSDWGWKRRCDDFKERENGHPARHD